MPLNELHAGAVAGIVDRVVTRYRRDPTCIVQILREVQEACDWIPPEAIDRMQTTLGVPRTKIEGVAGFYSFFYTRPRGKYRVLFSDNVTDRMLGSKALMDRLCNNLWIERGKVSEDGLVSVGQTACTGMCDQGPALLVNNYAVAGLTAARIDEIAELIRNKVPLAEWPPAYFRVEDNIRRADILLGSDLQAGDALKAAVARAPGEEQTASNMRSWREGLPAGLSGPIAMLDEIRRANLRGRGGAGFTTALKWDACRNAQLKAGQQRVVVCNADEGEPGTFKDRVLLTSYADLVFEGMTVARLCGRREARASSTCAANTAICWTSWKPCWRTTPRAGLLGDDILGTRRLRFRHRNSSRRRRLYLRRGIRADRVARRQARAPAQPSAVPGDARLLGAADGGGQRRDLCLCGENCAERRRLVRRDGYRAVDRHQAAFGFRRLRAPRHLRIPVRRHGAPDTRRLRRPRYVRGAGQRAFRHCVISWKEFDRRIAFEDLPTAGAFMVFRRKRDMFQVARNFVHFFAHESCGFCTPCRVGTELQKKIMDKIASGHGTASDLEEMKSLGHILQDHEPLRAGQHAPPTRCWIRWKNFPTAMSANSRRWPSSRPSTWMARWKPHADYRPG